MSKAYVLSVWLALLVHTGAHGIHVGSVCIVSLVSWLLLLFDARPSGPRRCCGHLGSFWLQQGERGGEQTLKEICMKWLKRLSVRQWQRYTMLMLFFCVFEVSVVYRILPVCCKFPSGCRCYVLYCQSLYIYCSCW